MRFLLSCVVACLLLGISLASSKSKPHGHQGILEPFDGTPLPLHLDEKQQLRLDAGEPVRKHINIHLFLKLRRFFQIVFKERSDKSGRGIVIQDVHALPDLCMNKIRDLTRYPQMVPNVKRVDIYDSHTFPNVSNF